MDKSGLGSRIEKAISFLCERFKNTETSKPTLFHSIRVGIRLYKEDYSDEIVIAGFLHDVLEDTDTTKEEIAKLFGEKVAEIVSANTKDKNLTNRDERHRELIKRCVETSEEAAIVKAADILDNFQFYTDTHNEEGIKYCRNNVRLMKEFLPSSYKDPILKGLMAGNFPAKDL